MSRRRWGEVSFGAALLLLVVNDHLLKGAGLLPTAVTGKLSDVAGLVVAPVALSMLAALAGFGGKWPRLAGFALVVSPFAAVNLAPEAARLLEASLLAIGIRWRLWPDPTDLLALSVLPLAWRLAVSFEQTVVERPRGRHVLATAAAGIACAATSVDPGSFFSTSAYLVSRARTTVVVEVFRPTVDLDCSMLDESARSLAPADLEHAFCRAVAPTGVLPLDRDGREVEADAVPAANAEPPCDAVVVRAEGLSPMLLYWRSSPNTKVFEAEGPGLEPQAVYLEPAGERLVLASSELITAAPFEPEPAPAFCAPGSGIPGDP